MPNAWRTLVRATSCWGVVLVATSSTVAAPEESETTSVDYNRDVRPVLAATCYACHGPDAGQRKARLRLDVADAAFAWKRGERRAIVPGDVAASALVARITHPDPEERMPPLASRRELSAEQIETLRRWIAEGATWGEHWSFEPPRRRDPPAVERAAWPRNPIDYFILSRLEREGLEPAPEADRTTLLRRLSFDLTGLPPSSEDIDAFLADTGEGAYERQVERLFPSPHHGERMAMFWLDLVRFADTRGYHSDNPRNVSPYRDWVIRAFARNLRFDRFTIEQLAGDLLPEAGVEQLVASCYNKLNQTTEEGGAQPKEYEAKNASDRVRNVSTVWLGATLGCAQCHDHKFDPYTARDFYAMAAFFADISEPAIMDRDQGVPVPTLEQQAALEQLDARIAEIRALATAPTAPADAPAQLAALENERAELEKAFPKCLVVKAGAPRDVRILPRGNWLVDTGDVVAPAIPAFLGALETSGARATRLDLARWLVSPENPLAARALVNRLWKLFFASGLSIRLDDLGAMGEPPSHPALLDWLALELRESGWDMRHVMRLIVTSSAYRQSSVPPARAFAHDAFNRLLARQSRWRLDAEMVRDNALAVSGLLSRQIGGPSVKPYQPDGYWVHLNFPKRTWVADGGDAKWRRGLYTWWQRSFPHPSLMAFDAPSREECTAERPRSNIPQQALVLLNDPTYVEAARAFAARAMEAAGTEEEGDARDTSVARSMFRRATSRWPDGDETAVLLELLAAHRASFRAAPGDVDAILGIGQAVAPAPADRAELAAWTSIARALLNLHETVTRN